MSNFVTVEGLDGCGSTTVVESLSEEYDDSVTTTEPTNSSYGKLVRKNLSDDTDPLVDYFLFMADRRDHIESLVKPAIDDDRLVISDRYADSTRAYQPVALSGEGDDTPFESVWNSKFFIEQTMAAWWYEPDLTIYLDISVDTALERNSGEEKFENREFLEEVKANYDALADTKERIVTVDAEQPADAVRAEVIKEIESL